MISVASIPPFSSYNYLQVQENIKIYTMKMLHGSDVDDSMILFLKEMLFEKNQNKWI